MDHVEIAQDGKAKEIGNNFHLMRYVLAALVLYSHSYGLLKLPEPGLFRYTLGSFSVKCFFVLSGYLITLSCLRSYNLGHFLINRALRIGPALVIALTASHFLANHFNSFIGNPVPYIINGPVWTLPWEIFCYCLCGLLWWLGLMTKQTIGSIVTTSWLLFISLPQSSETNTVIAPLFLLFFMGSFIALGKNQLNIRLSGPLFTLALLAICFDTKLLGMQWIFNQIPFLYGPNYSNSEYYYFLYLFSLPFSLIWLALHIKPILKIKNDYSYGIYIYGWPVQQALISLFSPTPIFLFAGSLLITHCLSIISWHLIEKKALTFKY